MDIAGCSYPDLSATGRFEYETFQTDNNFFGTGKRRECEFHLYCSMRAAVHRQQSENTH